MTSTQADTSTFEEHRPLLFSIAYRMLGSATEAEDAVQETWVRARQDQTVEVRSPRAYLASIVTRLCIDQLRSAARSRTEYRGEWLPEPIATPNQESPELAGSLSTAFLLLLEQLAPLERAVFLLREVFDYEFAEIGAMVGKTEANCRQILTRARTRLRSPHPRFRPSPEQAEQIVQQFRHATSSGDLSGLLALFHDEAQLIADGGGKVPAALKPLVGAERIARFFVTIGRKGSVTEANLLPVSINGAPGILLRGVERTESAYTFNIEAGKIRAVYIVRNPEKLRTLLSQLNIAHPTR